MGLLQHPGMKVSIYLPHGVWKSKVTRSETCVEYLPLNFVSFSLLVLPKLRTTSERKCLCSILKVRNMVFRDTLGPSQASML